MSVKCVERKEDRKKAIVGRWNHRDRAGQSRACVEISRAVIGASSAYAVFDRSIMYIYVDVD